MQFITNSSGLFIIWDDFLMIATIPSTIEFAIIRHLTERFF